MRNKRQGKFISIQSKVSIDTADRIDAVVKRAGFDSRYELMQYLLSAFLRYADPGGEGVVEKTADMYEFAKIFEGFENKKNRIITTKPSGNKALRMTDCIAIYSEEGKKGYVCRKLSVNGDGIHTTSNVDAALTSILKKLHPRIATVIQDIGRNIGESSYQKIIEYLIENEDVEIKKNGISNEVIKSFEKKSGKIEYGIVPKRKKNKSLDNE